MPQTSVIRASPYLPFDHYFFSTLFFLTTHMGFGESLGCVSYTMLSLFLWRLVPEWRVYIGIGWVLVRLH